MGRAMGMEAKRSTKRREVRRDHRRAVTRTKVVEHHADQRVHPRFETRLPVRISKRGGRGKKDVHFSASIDTQDISIGGMYLGSTFFLKSGMQIELAFDLPEINKSVEVSGEVAHVQDYGAGDRPSGFAIRFTEFHGLSEVYLRAFLARGDIYAFVRKHAKRLDLRTRDVETLVELIVRWEIHQERESNA